jgi:tetratricopeptide (TPR) repeat protein
LTMQNRQITDSNVVNAPLLVLQQAPEPSVRFVERDSISCDDVLAKLDKRHRVVISGLPGVGKSELVTQVVEKAIMATTKTYKGVFWLSSASDAILQSGIYEMARELKLLPDGSPPIEKVRRVVLNELNKEDHWLMVLDNVDDVDLIKNILPVQRGTRHVLITTRYGEAHSAINGDLIQLDSVTKDEAAWLFKRVHTEDKSRVGTNEAESTATIMQLVEELGCLPLAIIQAAAYLRETQDNIANYLEIWNGARTVLQAWKPMEGSNYMSVATVTALSFGKIKHQADSVRLFCLISFFAPDKIPELFCSSDPRPQSKTPREAAEQKAKLNSALAPLCAYSFVKRSRENDSISVHRLVHEVVRDIIEGDFRDSGGLLNSLDREQQNPKYWITLGIKSIGSVYNAMTWRQRDAYIPHAESCMKYAKKYNVTTEALSGLQKSMGWHLFDQALSINRNLYGVDHVETADALMNLSEARARQGNSVTADMGHALDIYQKVNSPSLEWKKKMGQVFHSRATIYLCAGQYNEAVQGYESALEMKRTAYGDRNIKLVSTLNALANMYSHQGCYEKAAERYDESLKIQKNAANPDAIVLANTMNSIGNMYVHQGKYGKAHIMYQSALNTYEEQYYRGHIISTKALNGIGNVMVATGQYEDAMVQFQRVLEIKEALYGKDSLYSANIINCIGNIFDSQGNVQKAKESYDRALKIYVTELGPNHIKSVHAIRNLGNISRYYGDYDTAIFLYEQALIVNEAAFGDTHPNSAPMLTDLAEIYCRQGKHCEALQNCERALCILEYVGEDHFNAINTRGFIYWHQGKWPEAIEEYNRALRVHESQFGRDHFLSASIIINIGNVYHSQKDYDSAIEYYRWALSLYGNKFPQDHVNTAPTIRNIGCTYKKQGKFRNAIEEYEHALRIYRRELPGWTPVDNFGDIDSIFEKRERLLKEYERRLGKVHIIWPDVLTR